MSDPTDDTPPAEERTPDAGAAPAGGWRRWMPRRRTAPSPAPQEASEGPEASEGSEQTGDDVPATGTAPDAVEAATADGEATDAEPVTAAAATDGVGRLRRKRKRLLSEREVTVYHLGGLAFELYRHDRLHPEVMQRRAGEIALIDETVQDIDLRLEQLATDRRNRRNREPDPRAPVGNCVACRAPFQVDARFCWQCGTQLIPTLPDPPQGVALDKQSTQTIERPTT